MKRVPLLRADPANKLQAAMQWALRLEEGPLPPQEERALSDWLAADDGHDVALARATKALDALDRHAGAAEMMALRSAALSARPRSRLRAWHGALVAGIAAAVVAAVTFTPLRTTIWPGDERLVATRSTEARPSIYRTAIGERSTVSLPDDSVVTLDTDSQIQLAYNAGERGVRLLRGQALFQVARGRRPFVVHARDQRIVAVGTIFNVRLDGVRVKVALVEGAVRVRIVAPSSAGDRARPPVREIMMSAGETLEATPQRQDVSRPGDLEASTSWRRGVLVFNGERLSDAVAEINRYTTRPIAIADSSVGDYRVSGVFRPNDPVRFSRAMADILPLSVTVAADGAPTIRERTR